jgi:hypothetical protein
MPKHKNYLYVSSLHYTRSKYTTHTNTRTPVHQHGLLVHHVVSTSMHHGPHWCTCCITPTSPPVSLSFPLVLFFPHTNLHTKFHFTIYANVKGLAMSEAQVTTRFSKRGSSRRQSNSNVPQPQRVNSHKYSLISTIHIPICSTLMLTAYTTMNSTSYSIY